MNNYALKIWLFLSSFGIMFAVLSWIQDTFLTEWLLSYKKGVFALITGFIMYECLAKKTISK
tara:strand:+ start:87 stop:272 length:186 start_codon:yes stop_codon:yes gene_type:complete